MTIKLLIVVGFTTLLSGCMWQDVDYEALHAIQEICAKRGGVLEITSYYDGEYSAICGDAEYITSSVINDTIRKNQVKIIAERLEGL